jgi:hypothetical protein
MAPGPKISDTDFPEVVILPQNTFETLHFMAERDSKVTHEEGVWTWTSPARVGTKSD